MGQSESVPVPRGWRDRAVWKGAGASLLLHLFVGAAMILTLSIAPKRPPQVIDLTLLPPAGIAQRPAPSPVVAAATPSRAPRTAVLPEPAALSAPKPVPNPSEAAVPGSPSGPAVNEGAPAAGSPHALAEAPGTTGAGSVNAVAGSPPGISGAAPPAEDFAWIRDAIQHAIAYPATARRMGWEGKVVVAFQVLPDGSVRDVRVVQGSGHAALDRGAVDAVRNASPFHRLPVEAEVITPVIYRLTTR